MGLKTLTCCVCGKSGVMGYHIAHARQTGRKAAYCPAHIVEMYRNPVDLGDHVVTAEAVVGEVIGHLDATAFGPRSNRTRAEYPVALALVQAEAAERNDVLYYLDMYAKNLEGEAAQRHLRSAIQSIQMGLHRDRAAVKRGSMEPAES